MVQYPACLQPGKLKDYWNEKAKIVLLKTLQCFTKLIKPNDLVFFFLRFFLKTTLLTPPYNPHKFSREGLQVTNRVLVRVQHQVLLHGEKVMSTICVKFSGNRSYLPAFILSTHVPPSNGAKCFNRAHFQAMMIEQRSWEKIGIIYYISRQTSENGNLKNSWDAPINAAPFLSVTRPCVSFSYLENLSTTEDPRANEAAVFSLKK